MDAHVDGIVVLNRGASLALRGGKPFNPCGLTTSLVIFFSTGCRQVGRVIGSFSALDKIGALPWVRHAQEQG